MLGTDRPAAAAGRFYPDDPDRLRRTVEDLLAEAGAALAPPPSAPAPLGVLLPHAGYVYSGKVAGAVVGNLCLPECVVLLGPNHTGQGDRVALRDRGDWLLPDGRVPVDGAVCAQVARSAPDLVTSDDRAHRYEHCLEVELPLLRARNPALRIVPLVLGPLTAAECRTLGRALADCLPEGVLVVASSDMNHYLPDALTRVRDRLALDPLLALDPTRLYETCVREDLSMCGFIPATILLEYANARGARRADLVRYATSAEAFGDTDRVVGYAGVTISP